MFRALLLRKDKNRLERVGGERANIPLESHEELNELLSGFATTDAQVDGDSLAVVHGQRGRFSSLSSQGAEIVRRSDTQKGFAVLPRRWVVERTFGWLANFRRLSKSDT